MAFANEFAGKYAVTATVGTLRASFAMTNQASSASSDLADPSITSETASVDFIGSLEAGSQFPDGEPVAKTLGGVVHDYVTTGDGVMAETTAFPVRNLASTADSSWMSIIDGELEIITPAVFGDTSGHGPSAPRNA